MNKEKIFQMFSLEGKVAIITGGAGMLGTEYAKTLIDAGAKVISLDIKKPQEAIKNCIYKLCNIADKTSIKTSVSINIRKIMDEFGQIDILVNNAASTDFEGFTESQRFAPYEDFSLDLFRKEIEVSIIGTQIVTQEVVRHMKKSGQGNIIFISSTHGLVAPDNTLYGKGKFKPITYPVVKSSILGFTRAWASALGQYGIRVNCLCPSGVDTGYMDDEFRKKFISRTLLGRMANKSDYNGIMLFLCSDASAYMTGSIVVIDGGWTTI